MTKPSPYTVLLRALPTQRTLEVPPALVSAWLKGLPMRDALGAPEEDPNAGEGIAKLEFYAEGAHVFVAGTFDGHLTVACSRCVGPVRIEIAERLRVTYLPRHELPSDEPAEPGEEGIEVGEEDLDVFPYDGDAVDLEPLFREQFVLSVPFAPLCSETCKGLCPQCGIDRNTATCSCEKPVDPRLAALKGLKIPS